MKSVSLFLLLVFSASGAFADALEVTPIGEDDDVRLFDGYVGINAPSATSGAVLTVLPSNNQFHEIPLQIGRKTGYPSIKSLSGHLIIDSAGWGDYLSINHYVSDDVALAYGGGNVGIGDFTPSYKLDVAGYIRTTMPAAYKLTSGTWSGYSDARLKQNIRPISGALDVIMQLQGVQYDWINPEQHGVQTEAGFVAQDVEKLFPGWVSEMEPEGDDRDLIPSGEKAKALGLPIAFQAYAVEAMRELHAENQALQGEVWKLRQLVCVDHPSAGMCSEKE